MRIRIAGFSFIEILIVISLIGSLTFGTALGINKQLSKARDAQRKLQLKGLAKALEEYYDSTLCYPAYIPSCGQKFQLGNAMLLDTVPCDPYTHLPYLYMNEHFLCNSQYKLYANLENKEDSDINYLGCKYGCGPQCDYNYGHTSPNTTLDSCPAPITPTPIPSSTTPTPTPTTSQEQYVCAPGIGNNGHCTLFVYPELSDCPKIWINDPTCNSECNIKANHCKNSKGKKP